MNVLIMAGGAGTRLWPASRKAKPKQLLTFIGHKTLLQNTYERFSGLVPPEQIFIGTTASYLAAVKKQLPEIPPHNFSLEPAIRDRGPAIGLAALIMEHYQPGSIFVTAWSDHHIDDKKKYHALLKNAERYLTDHPKTTLVVGVPPTTPHTGLGYIQKGQKIRNGEKLALNKVASFKEKPNLINAKRFLAKKNYLWNTGIFMWRASELLHLYKEYLPKVYNLLMEIKPALGTSAQQNCINRLYLKMPNVDIETALIEKLKDNVAVITANFNWADVGSWKIIKDMQSRPAENLSQGRHVDFSSRGVLVYNYTKKQLVATLGLNNIIVIATPDAILVADKDNSEELKLLISKLKSDTRYKKYL